MLHKPYGTWNNAFTPSVKVIRFPVPASLPVITAPVATVVVKSRMFTPAEAGREVVTEREPAPRVSPVGMVAPVVPMAIPPAATVNPPVAMDNPDVMDVVPVAAFICKTYRWGFSHAISALRMAQHADLEYDRNAVVHTDHVGVR